MRCALNSSLSTDSVLLPSSGGVRSSRAPGFDGCSGSEEDVSPKANLVLRLVESGSCVVLAGPRDHFFIFYACLLSVLLPGFSC